MKQILSFILIFISQTGFAQTQSEMNNDANESCKKADKELNEIYKQILSGYKSDTAFLRNLKSSQRIWITFRDAELKVRYPETDPVYYGSVYPMCVYLYLEQLTKERIKTLKQWIDGVDETEACKGSVKTKE